MFIFEQEAMLVQDREDLIQLLRMRFGTISSGIIEEIYQVNKMETIERLILVAANASDYNVFVEELREGDGSFKLVGERFNPIEYLTKKGEDHGEQE